MLEAINICQERVECELKWNYPELDRISDYIWWISDNCKLAQHYPNWKLQHNFLQILQEIYEFNQERWQQKVF